MRGRLQVWLLILTLAFGLAIGLSLADEHETGEPAGQPATEQTEPADPAQPDTEDAAADAPMAQASPDGGTGFAVGDATVTHGKGIRETRTEIEPESDENKGSV
jgi:uncharacterized iron-regulated membrane protein